MAGLPWFRLYTKSLDAPKVQRLPGDAFKLWINLLCVACRDGKEGGALPSLPDLAFILRIPEDAAAQGIEHLIAVELLDNVDGALYPHDWQEHQYESDSSTARVQRHRAAKRDGNGNETPPTVPPPIVPVTFSATAPQRSGNVPSLPTGNVPVTVQIQSQIQSQTQRESAPKLSGPALMCMRQDFERFMAAYPAERAGDKNGNWFAWQAQAQAENLDPIDTIMAGLEAHKKSTHWQEGSGRFVPKAIRFINEELWKIAPRNDEPKKPSRGPMPAPDLPARGKAVY